MMQPPLNPLLRRLVRPFAGGRLTGNAGFTLIEVMITALIVVLIASAAASALISTAHFSGDQRFRSEADALATQDQERLRGMSDAQLGQLGGAGSTRQAQVDGSTYTVRSTATYEDSTGGSSCNSGSAAYYKITSTVSWTEAFSSQGTSVTEESLLSRPVTGDLMTQVHDETGQQGVSGVTVKAVGPTTQSAVTDASGCTMMAGLTPGLYNVTLSDPGYVDVNGGTSSFTGTATVTTTGVAQTTNSPFTMGWAGSIDGTFTTNLPDPSGQQPGATMPGQSDAISWIGSGGSQSMTKGYQTTTAAGPMATLATGLLFPFDTAPSLPASYTNNYTVWAGRCLQQEPPAAYDKFTVPPGSTNQAQNVVEPTLVLGSTYLGQPVKPANVKITFTPGMGAACNSYSWWPAVASGTSEPTTGWLASPGQPFASLATTGPTASAASGNGNGPETGSLTICVDGTPPNKSTSYTGTLTGVTNTDFSANPAATVVPLTVPGVCT